MFTGNTTLDLIILIAIAVIFVASIISLMIYNPNYSFKELLKKPWLIFDLIKKAADNVSDELDDAQKALDKLEDEIEETKDAIQDVKDTLKK